MTTIRYFIPEDGDMETQPNVFLAPKSRQQGYPPTLSQIKQSFPLSGRYHFRFKSALLPGTDREKGALPVWMDCTDERLPVPAWRSQIVAKVVRIGIDEDDDDDDEDFHRPPQRQDVKGKPQAPAQMTPQPAKAPAPAPSFDLFDAGPAPAPPAASQGHSMGNLLDSHPQSHAPAPTSGGGSLLDMSYPTQPKPAHSDFLGMTAAPSPPVSGNYPPMGIQMQGQQRPPQQQQQPPPQRSNASGSFDSFGSNGQGAFGGLGTPWK